MSLKDKVVAYLELLDSPGYSLRQRDELLADLADEVGYATPQLTQKEILEQVTFVDTAAE